MMNNAVSASEAVSLIKSGHSVFIHGAAATPLDLIDALVARAHELEDVELMHIHTEGDAEYSRPEYQRNFKITNFFVGANTRRHLNQDNVEYLPCFLSEIPQLFRSGVKKPNVAMITVSPPDSHGFCSMGTSLDVARAGADTADIIIAEINYKMPRVHGDTFIHINRFDAYVEVDRPLPVHPVVPPSETEIAIGRKVAGLIEDGATLQVGIGAIPNCVLSELKDHKHLGVHTEMWSNGMLELIKCGAVDNSRKKIHPGISVSTFLNGDQELFDFVNNNPSVMQLEASFVNDPSIIKQNPKVTAINSAVEIDLTGQVCADSVGSRVISGVGGQMDFIRGASLSPGGLPIIAMTSRSKKGFPKIVSQLKPGAGVVTTRAHVHYVITEYGAVNLAGLNLTERAKALIELAHPEDRELLLKQWWDLKH